jgi:PAS domain S-box-containing protein
MIAKPAAFRTRIHPSVVVVIGLGAVAVALYFALPTRAQLFWYVVIEAYSALAALWCARRLPVGQRAGALWVTAGLTAFAVADGLFNGAQLISGHATSFPSPADGVYLLGYPLITAGAAVFITRSGLRFTATTALETAIVVVVAASLQWVMVGPDANSTLGTLILFAYTVGDALLIALVVRGLVDPAGRTGATTLFLAGAVALLLADIIYATHSGSYAVGDWYDVLWLTSGVLIAGAIAAAASTAPLPARQRSDLARQSPAAFLVILGVALLVTPVAFVWYASRHRLGDSAALVLAGTSVALTALVFARLALLMRAMNAAQHRESAARRAAEQSHARLASLMAQMQSGVLVEDADRRIALVNEEFCRIFALDVHPQHLLGADSVAVAEHSKHLTADPEGFVALIGMRMAARETALSDVVRFADGRVFERDFVPIDLGGGDTGTLWQYREVTERVRLEEQLRISQARNAATIDTALDAVIWMDAAGRVAEFNPAAEAMFGFSRAEAIGRQLDDLIVPERMRAAHARGLARVLAGGASALIGSRLELEALHADGHEFPIELAISAMEDESPMLFTAFMRDITARKRAERELAAARDEAVRAAELKSEFLATMSHEIRTPMYGVIGTLDLLRQSELDTDQRELVGVMHDSAHGLLEIINGVLDFSKLEAGKVQLATESFSLRAIAEGVADLLGPEARRKALRLVTWIDPHVPGLVRGDPGRVRQVLVNLVGNAVKFTDGGDVVLRIALDGEDQNGPVVRCEVADTGAGIPQDRQNEIFQPFTQVDSGRARSHAGTGLGLAISLRLVQAMGGTIACASAPGHGTTLTVHLPFDAVPAELETVTERPLRGRRLALDLRPGIAGDAFADALRGLGADIIPLQGLGQTMSAEYDLAIIEGGWTVADGPVLIVAAGVAAALGSYGPSSIALPIRSDRLADAVLEVIGAPVPRTRAAAAARAPVRAARVPRADRIAGDTQLPQVLLVEDNDVNRSLAQRQLAQLGVSCHAVASGAEALEALRRGAYAVVLMDCRMPEMDGFEATRRIRDRETKLGLHTPIIALTADNRPEDRGACLAAGMDDHVGKPMTTDDLHRALVRWLPAPSAAPDESATSLASGEDEPGITSLLEQIGQEETVRLFRTWQTETPRRLEAMRIGVDREDPRAVADAAHVLKSTCGLFGAHEAAQTAAAAEDAARNGNPGELPALFHRLEDQISRAVVDLEMRLTT